MRRTVLIATAVLAASQACAGTAGGLLAACNSPDGTDGAKICGAYINGLGEGILGDQIAREDGAAICLPDGISTTDIRETLKAFIAARPAAMAMPSGGVVAAAMQAAYPCKK